MRRARLVLLDFDGVLASYSHAVRFAHLARSVGCSAERVRRTLMDDGLEARYDAGMLSTLEYLGQLGDALEVPVDADAWCAARRASTHVTADTVARVALLAERTAVGILSNNGPLMGEVIRELVPSWFPRLEGAVLLSGALGARKPEPVAFQRALAHFGVATGDTLFVDDSVTNVAAATRLGLDARQAEGPAALRRTLSDAGFD